MRWEVLRRHGGRALRLFARRPLEMALIEVTTFCNLQCAGCVRTVAANGGRWQNLHMSVADFTKLVAELPPAQVFIPQGIGESTCHPELETLLRIAKSSGKFGSIEMNTNALVRDAAYFGALFDAGLSYLTVSVDTLDSRIIASVRNRTDPDELRRRLQALLTRFQGRIGARVTVSTRNAEAVGALLSELNAMGRMKVWLQPFFDMGENASGVMSLDARRAFVRALPALTAGLDNLVVEPGHFVPSAEMCPSPWSSPAVTVQGDVKPCCLVLHHEPISFGNAITGSFRRIWASRELRRFRADFRRQSPPCCARCPLYTVRSPREA